MRILYISQHFPPEMGALSARVSELSRYWVEMGHEVTVLTCFPNYPDGVIYENYKDKVNKLYHHEEFNGIKVIRVWSYLTHLRSTLRRSTNYLSSLLSFSLTASIVQRPDVVIVTSPPPFIGLTTLTLKTLRGIPVVFEVRDLWPEVITTVGAGNTNSISYRIINSVVDFSYKYSDLIVAVTRSFKDSIVNTRGIDEEKVKVIENAVDTEFFKPIKTDKSVFKKLGLENKFIVSYVGTIGLTHSVDVVINAAQELNSKTPNIVFLLVGDGFEKNRLEACAKSKGLNNVFFLGKQQRSKIPDIINSSDISLVLSKKSELLEKTIFAKVFEPMACGKPIIVGALGETRNIVVDQGNAGLSFEPECTKELIECISKLYNDSGLRKKLGDNGRKLVLKSYSRKKKAKEYIQILSSLVDNKKGSTT